jgi:hypothetical protein
VAVLCAIVSATGLTLLRAEELQPNSAFGHPHEPEGFVELAETSFESMNGGGFTKDKRNTLGAIVQDPTAPHSPPNVYRMLYTKGPHDGEGSVNRLWTVKPPGGLVRAMYVHFWWKVSENWYGHPSGVNKMLFLTTVYRRGGNTGVVVETGNRGTGSLQVRVVTQGALETANYFANVNTEAKEIKRGTWQEWEVLVRAPETGKNDAELHLWLDRVKVIESKMPFLEDAKHKLFERINLDPIWGGRNGALPEEQYFYCDYMYVSYKE